MAKIIKEPQIIIPEGKKEKIIKEFFGVVNTGNKDVSIAVMNCPGGWTEPGQTPEFDEYTVVIKGEIHVKTEKEEFVVRAGQAIQVNKNEWVQYSTPHPDGAYYVSVCIPAFTPETAKRDN